MVSPASFVSQLLRVQLVGHTAQRAMRWGIGYYKQNGNYSLRHTHKEQYSENICLLKSSRPYRTIFRKSLYKNFGSVSHSIPNRTPLFTDVLSLTGLLKSLQQSNVNTHQLFRLQSSTRCAYQATSTWQITGLRTESMNMGRRITWMNILTSPSTESPILTVRDSRPFVNIAIRIMSRRVIT